MTNQLIIRKATLQDLEQVVLIEGKCFPVAEAAKEHIIKERLLTYSKGFLIGELNGKIIGFINGGSTDETVIDDAFFETMDLHANDGNNLVIFGLDVHPHYQRNGYAKLLMNEFISFAKSENKKSIILTCKSHLIKYYEGFGYKNLGISDSAHGGAQWYDMVLEL